MTGGGRGPSAEKDAPVPGHEGVSYDLTCPREYTARFGWNIYCECGASLGDTGYTDAEQEELWQAHLAGVRTRVTPPAKCPGCGREGGLCVECTEDGAFGHQTTVLPPGSGDPQ